MSFSIQEYLKENFEMFIVGTSDDERAIECVVCHKPKHLYYNVNKNLWDCKRCGAQGNLTTFIMYHRGLEYVDAIDFIQQGVERDKSTLLKSKLNDFKNSVKKEKEIVKININVGKCDFMFLTEKLFEKFKHLKRRNITYSVFKSIKPMPFICMNHSRFQQLEDRMIFPIICDGHISYQAYDVTGKRVPKTWNPPGSINSELLFLYDQYKKSDKPLVVVEGIFDALRVLTIDDSVNCVALLGSNLSTYQAFLLGNSNASEIILMLDGDVYTKKDRKYFHKMYGKMNTFCDNWTLAKIYDPARDPGNLRDHEYYEIIKRRYLPHEGGRLGGLKASLKSLSGQKI